MEINKELLDSLFEQAKENPRLRQNLDLRTSSADTSQRMLNALLPGTVVPVHRHPQSTENVFLLCGKIVEVICDENGNEIERIHLDPTIGNYGCVVPQGAWHTVEVLEPSVIYEAKDGKYGEDGSETFDAFLKKNIEDLIEMEHRSGSMDFITPLYVSRMLNVPLEEVEKVMREAQF
ncbi:WbuC family cupin fold metalloprotein [uncultured Prevotella sp.]|uniref:WbuC family cupin fold metalloprotein n=1 Tax=uncultured Prevotella sp. TaxID=159272 RepID=UPI00263443D1|nr:WbuC family cupin fold metalloprotein [uncultured Prevotella sp.]